MIALQGDTLLDPTYVKPLQIVNPVGFQRTGQGGTSSNGNKLGCWILAWPKIIASKISQGIATTVLKRSGEPDYMSTTTNAHAGVHKPNVPCALGQPEIPPRLHDELVMCFAAVVVDAWPKEVNRAPRD
jgi:hypothetical protein